jgi:hypothetical protein
VTNYLANAKYEGNLSPLGEPEGEAQIPTSFAEVTDYLANA